MRPFQALLSMFYLEILKKQEIGRGIYKETGRLPMFLFQIPFELSWKHKGIIKQWLYKYFLCFYLLFKNLVFITLSF